MCERDGTVCGGNEVSVCVCVVCVWCVSEI